MPENPQRTPTRAGRVARTVAAVVAVMIVAGTTGLFAFRSDQSTAPKTATTTTTTTTSATTTSAAAVAGLAAAGRDGMPASATGGGGGGEGKSRVLPPANSRSLNAVVVVPAEDPHGVVTVAAAVGPPSETHHRAVPASQPPLQPDAPQVGRESTYGDWPRHHPRYNHKTGGGHGSATIDRTAHDVTEDTDARRNVAHRQMDYRDYSNAPETDDWKPVRDVPWSGDLHRPYESTYYGVRGGDDDGRSDGPTAVAIGESVPGGGHAATTVSELPPPPRYSTIQEPPANYYYPTQPAAAAAVDLQPTGTVTHWRQPLVPGYQPPGASHEPPGASYEQPPPGASYRRPPGPINNDNNNDYRPSRIAAGASWPYSASGAAEKKTVVPAASWGADAVDWRLVGTAALVKLGLAKLKAFALLNALLVLLFKLKAFAIAAVFKFALLLKLLKFFKALSAPLLLAPLLALLSSPLALTALSAIPSRLLQTLLALNNSSAAAVPGLPGVPGLPSLPSVLSPGQLVGPMQGLLPGGAPGSGRPTGLGGSVLRPSAAAKSDEPSDSRRGRPDEWPPESFYPTLEVFRELLDTEKCVERIACRMAVAEKSGAMPTWINWVLRGVSKGLPNEKLETYFKTFDDVNNGSLTNSSTIDNQKTWCFEHFDCNKTNVTHVTDTKQ